MSTVEPTFEDDPQRVLVTAGEEQWTVQALRDRISWLEPGVILMREINKGTPETLVVMTQAFEVLTADCPAYGVVLDLEGSHGSTTAEYRKFIPKHFTEVFGRSGGRLKLVAVAFLGSPVARVASKFLIGRMIQVPMSIEKDQAAAHKAVLKALGK